MTNKSENRQRYLSRNSGRRKSTVIEVAESHYRSSKKKRRESEEIFRL